MKRWRWIEKSGRIGLLLGLFLLLASFVLGCLGGGSKEEPTAAQGPSGSPGAAPGGAAGGPTASPVGGTPAGGPTGGPSGPPTAGPMGGPGSSLGGGAATQGLGPGGPPVLAEAPLPEAKPPAQKVPKDPVDLAILLKNKRKMDFAAASARKGVQRKPQSARAHYVLAWILVHVGKRDEAIREFNKALQLKLGGKDRQEAESALQRLKSGGAPVSGPPGGPAGAGGPGR